MTVGALHPLFGVDVHHMDRLAGLQAGRHELAFDAGLAGIGAGEAEVALLRVAVMIAALAPFLGILGVDDMRGIGAIGRHVYAGVEQIAAAVALEAAADVPAVALILGRAGGLVL